MRKGHAKLNDFLDRKHGKLTNHVFASLGFLGTGLVTQNWELSKQSYFDFTSGDLKLGARRAGWLSKRFWNQKIIFDDHEFNFAQGLSPRNLKTLEKKLLAKRENLATTASSALDINIDLLNIWSNLAEQEQGVFGEIRAPYEAAANAIIAHQFKTNFDSSISQKSSNPRKAIRLEDAKTALLDFQNALLDYCQRWFLVSGTFLGMIREGNFLAHDYDLDFGFFGEDIEPEPLIALLENAEKFHVRKVDYQQIYRFGQTKMVPQSRQLTCIKLKHHTGLNIDIFIHYRDGEWIWHGSNLHRWDNSNFALKSYEFAGTEVWGAEDSDRYLTENYGDWRTPVKSFHLAVGTPNLRLVHNLASVTLSLRRVGHAQNEGELNRQIALLKAAGLVNDDNRFQLFDDGEI